MTADSPEISIVITVVSGASHLEACLQGLAGQQGCDPEKLEIIVPFDERDQKIRSLKAGFPNVIFHATRLALDAPAWLSHENFDDLRAVGLGLAHGRIIAMLIDHEIPDPSWCRKMLEAHAALPHAAIGGAVENGIDRPLNWATYFFDFGRYQNPVDPGASSFLTDVNIGYKREALNDIRHVWERRFHEPYVHGELLARGHTLWLSPEIVVHVNRAGLKLSEVIRERYVWGRYFAGNRVAAGGGAMRAVYCVFSPAIPFIILAKMLLNVLQKNRLIGKFFLALPFTVLLTVVWSWGEFVGYLTKKPSAFKPAVQA